MVQQVEITLLLLVILPTLAVYKSTKEGKTMGKRELNEQRELSQNRLNSVESRVKKIKAQYIQANKDWLGAKSKEEGVKALPKGIYYKVLSEGFLGGMCMTVAFYSSMISAASMTSGSDRGRVMTKTVPPPGLSSMRMSP